MRKKIFSFILSIIMIFASLPVLHMDVSAEYLSIPTGFSAPEINATSNKSQVYITVTHPEDVMRYIEASQGKWADANGGEANRDYWWTGYGKGYGFDSYVQIDWRVPGGDWHYTTEWDTDLGAGEAYIADSTYFYGGDCGGSYYVFNNSECYNAEADSVYYPLKEHFDEFFDGYDYYYLFDQNKTVEFRCRYLCKVTSGGYNDNYETEETVSYISSDWSATEIYGAGGNAQAEIPSRLVSPTLESPSVSEGTGSGNANEIYFQAYTPLQIAKLRNLRIDIEEISLKNVETRMLIEASLDGENWRQFKTSSPENVYSLDTSDVWFYLIREDDSLGWRDYVWETRDVYIRARYFIEYAVNDYTTETVSTKYGELEGPYSNVLKVNVPGVNLYNININYKNDGASDYSKKSYTCNENSRLGWINTRPLEGFYVTKVLVNGQVMFDKEDESTHTLLEWYNDQEFRFWDDPLATENLEIDIYFGGTAPTKHTLSYTKNENSTGNGDIDVSYAGGYYTLSGDTDSVKINQGLTATLQVEASNGCVISSIIVDGESKYVPSGTTETEITLSSIDADHSIEVKYDRVAHYCYASKSGNGTVTITAPDYFEDNYDYVNTGDTFTVHAEAEEGYKILRITINGEDQNLENYGDSANLVTADISVTNVTEEKDVHVYFSTPDTEYVTLTINWNEGGECNSGITTETVTKGYNYNLYIQPYSGYSVARIIDGDTVIDNFVGEYYYIRNLDKDRVVTVEFEETKLPMIFGDVNRDGKVNAVDALLVLKISAKILPEANETQMHLGDVNGEGVLNASDALLILQKAAGIIDKFPVG